MLGLPVSRIHAWTRQGLLSPERGPRGVYVYSFRDIAVLRSARELLAADVPARRVGEALHALREQLPLGRPLSALQLTALGSQVLVREGSRVWSARTGQLHLELGAAEADEHPGPSPGAVARRGLSPDTRAPAPGPGAEDWFERGLELEGDDPAGAAAAYRRALELDPTLADAHLNLGRILHEEGSVAEAEARYRAAIAADSTSARARFNLGVALEDQERVAEAIGEYEAALGLDPDLAAAHFNLSRLHESRGREAEALAHLVEYKRLLDGSRRSLRRD